MSFAVDAGAMLSDAAQADLPVQLVAEAPQIVRVAGEHHRLRAGGHSDEVRVDDIGCACPCQQQSHLVCVSVPEALDVAATQKAPQLHLAG